MNDDQDPPAIPMNQVIKFKPRENGEVLNVRPPSECQHYSFEVDEEAGEVSCEQCGKDLDPIFVLMRLTRLYKEQDYKYDRIVQFEAESRAKAAKQREYYARKQARRAEQSK